MEVEVENNAKVNITCENCGGTDFCMDGGFYFCTECQTQSQEYQQTVYNKIESVNVIEKRKSIKEPKKNNERIQLTSWETYNYILRGLVDELQTIGATAKLKNVVHLLWINYLTKLEVIGDKPDDPPKLSVNYRKRDAEIVYERRATKKRKKKTDSNISVSDLDSRTQRLERNKQRRKMEELEYNQYTASNKSDDKSVSEQTLSDFSSDSDSSSVGHIIFNKSSTKTLTKKMGKEHLQRHAMDVNNELNCHKINSQLLPRNFVNGPDVISREKLYCILYLGLLLSLEEFQISDLIRFCREGHVSYMDYRHFFPDDLDDRNIDTYVFTVGRKALPSHSYIRKVSFQFLKYLDLPIPKFNCNLLKLCKRYCKELNLPDQIYNIAGEFLIQTKPSFPTDNTTVLLPNYEGRIMGFIIYVLKLLLGLDDITEFELSKLADKINKTKSAKEKLFSFSNWMHYIEYRKIVLKYFHFPTWFQLDKLRDCPIELYTQFLSKTKDITAPSDNSNLTMKITKDVLLDLFTKQGSSAENLIDFDPSVTPFKSYIDKIKNKANIRIFGVALNNQILADKSKESIEYLIEPQPYLKLVKSDKCQLNYSNAHPNQTLLSLINSETGTLIKGKQLDLINQIFEEQRFEILSFDELTDRLLVKHIDNVKSGKEIEKPKSPIGFLYPPLDPTNIKRRNSTGRTKDGKFCKLSDSQCISTNASSKCNSKTWKISYWYKKPLPIMPNTSLLHQVAEDAKTDKVKRKTLNIHKKLNKDTYKYHYIPRSEYCINYQNINKMTVKEWQKFESRLPDNFRWLLNECARILEQTTKELYQEFINVEIYMSYVYFDRVPLNCDSVNNYKIICNLIKNVKRKW